MSLFLINYVTILAATVVTLEASLSAALERSMPSTAEVRNWIAVSETGKVTVKKGTPRGRAILTQGFAPKLHERMITKKMILHIIRHGETELNKQRILQGWIDEPLNENGRLLAVKTGQAIQDVHFDACISSPLIRAEETAEIILRESGSTIPVQTDERIKEMHFGSREGTRLNKEEAELFFGDTFSFGRFPGGESAEEVCRRTQSFLKELLARSDDKTYLISTHGCAMRAMLNSLYDNPSDFWQGHVPRNCALNILEAVDGNVKFLQEERIYYERL